MGILSSFCLPAISVLMALRCVAMRCLNSAVLLRSSHCSAIGIDKKTVDLSTTVLFFLRLFALVPPKVLK